MHYLSGTCGKTNNLNSVEVKTYDKFYEIFQVKCFCYKLHFKTTKSLNFFMILAPPVDKSGKRTTDSTCKALFKASFCICFEEKLIKLQNSFDAQLFAGCTAMFYCNCCVFVEFLL